MGVKLSETAMTVNFRLSTWNNNKFDREISAEVAKKRELNQGDAGRYIKVLMPYQELTEIYKIAREWRQFHRWNTMPWKDNNVRLVACKRYSFYSDGMRKREIAFDDAVDLFVPKYPEFINLERQRLKDFKQSDYPDDIAPKFGHSIKVEPLMDPTDWRTTLRDDQIEDIKKKLLEEEQERKTTLLQDLWQRLFDPVKSMATQLSKDKPRIHKSLVANIMEICDVLPDLNILEDGVLDGMRQEILNKLTWADAETLRKTPVVRKTVAKDAQDILDTMSGYMGI